MPQRSQSSAASLTSIGADISPSSSHFFEVITFLHPHILFEERGYINYYPTWERNFYTKFRNKNIFKIKICILFYSFLIAYSVKVNNLFLNFLFQVFYVGKIKVSNPKVQESFIDDALIRFRVHVLEKSRSSTSNLLTECQRLQRQAVTSSINRRNSTVRIIKMILL